MRVCRKGVGTACGPSRWGRRWNSHWGHEVRRNAAVPHANPPAGAVGGAPYGATSRVRGVPKWGRHRRKRRRTRRRKRRRRGKVKRTKKADEAAYPQPHLHAQIQNGKRTWCKTFGSSAGHYVCKTHAPILMRTPSLATSANCPNYLTKAKRTRALVRSVGAFCATRINAPTLRSPAAEPKSPHLFFAAGALRISGDERGDSFKSTHCRHARV